MALLAPEEPGSTLALSSLRSESVKGFVTRIGTRIVKGVSCFDVVLLVARINWGALFLDLVAVFHSLF